MWIKEIKVISFAPFQLIYGEGFIFKDSYEIVSHFAVGILHMENFPSYF